MIDIERIRDHGEEIEKQLRTKDPSLSLASIVALDRQVRLCKTEKEAIERRRKEQARERQLPQEGTNESKERYSLVKERLASLEEELQQALAALPNLPEEGSRVSLDPKDNVEIGSYGSKPHFSFSPKNHVQLSESLSLFDFKRGAKLAGSGWPTYRGWGARLEWALLQLMVDIQVKNGFEQWILPVVARPELLYSCGQLPKFKEQLFALEDGWYLIPTAEAALNGLHYDEILDGEGLPYKYTSYTPCFRREAGAAGSQERGLIRTHQFNKVELFCLAKPEESQSVYDEIVRSAQEVLETLELHYRSMLLVTGDMSFAASKTIDLEVWLPGQGRYYEVSSISHCTDFQARRSKIRYRGADGKLRFVHTLNGSGLATSRLLVALLENNQRAEGTIGIPQALQPYLGGVAEIGPPSAEKI